MSKSEKKTVAFLWHPGIQARVFGLIADALPADVAVKRLAVHRMVIEKRLSSPFLPHPSPSRAKMGTVPSEAGGLSPFSRDLVESLTYFDYLRKTCGRPDLATDRYRQRLGRVAVHWYRYLHRKLAGVDLLVVWNGYKRPASCAVLAAGERGARVVFCENGALPGTLAMDPAGINYANSLTGLGPEFYRNVQMDPAKADALLGTKLQQRPFRVTARVTLEDCDDAKPLPDRFVLYAMQVHDDSQVWLFSPRFPSMESAVPYVADRVAAYNQRSGDTLKLVVKEHPSDFRRANYAAMRAALPEVHFLRTTPVSHVIDSAAAVLTLNSTVGIEALLRFRPVITLGDAFYNVPGVVRHLGPDEDLADLLADAIDAPVDRDLITRFLYFLRYEYLVPVSKKSCARDTIGPAADRVLDVLYGRWPNWETPRSGDGGPLSVL